MNAEQAIIDADWERFASLDELINHWAKPGWEPGKRAYFWYLTFGDRPALRGLTGALQESLAAPYLDPIDPGDLHMTLDPVGLESDFSDDDIRSVESAAKGVCESTSPFTIDVGPLAGSSGAVRFSVTPWEPIVQVRSALHQAVKAKIPQVRTVSKIFNPHIGIAYCNSNMSAEPLIQAVHSMRGIPKVTVEVDRVSLVLLERLERSWKWTTKRSFPLNALRSEPMPPVGYRGLA